MKVQWNSPARPNGDIVSYTVHHKDPVQLDITSTLITPDESEFSARRITLHGLAAYHRSVAAGGITLASYTLKIYYLQHSDPLPFYTVDNIPGSRFSTDQLQIKCQFEV